MGTYGKILGIANIVAIAVFLWVAGLNYGKRQSWQFAEHEEEILMHGLPADQNELDAEGRRVASTINPKMEQQLFQGAGQPVKTGKQEVENRHAALRSAIDGLDTDQAKREKLASVLLPLAHSLSEREQLKGKIAKDNIEDLMGAEGPFEEAFREAIEGKKDVQGQMDYQGWRESIARVLVNTQEPQELQRAVIIAGLETYLNELNSQATALEKMQPELEAAMSRERTAWELEHRSLLQQIVGLSERLQALEGTLQKQEGLRDQQHKTQVQARKQNVDELNDSVARARDDLKAELAKEAELKKELEDASKGVAEAHAQNEKLQSQLKERAASR
jgi:hypothetical protein